MKELQGERACGTCRFRYETDVTRMLTEDFASAKWSNNNGVVECRFDPPTASWNSTGTSICFPHMRTDNFCFSYMEEQEIKVMAPKRLMRLLRVTAKLREESYNPNYTQTSEVYGLDLQQAAEKACEELNLDARFAYPVCMLLNAHWDDILDWAGG